MLLITHDLKAGTAFHWRRGVALAGQQSQVLVLKPLGPQERGATSYLLSVFLKPDGITVYLSCTQSIFFPF